MKYGVLEGGKLTRFKNPTNLKELAKSVLSREILKDCTKDSRPKNLKDGICKYMDEWVVWSYDTEEPVEMPSQIVDVAVDTIVYSNKHFIDLRTNVEISDDKRAKLNEYIIDLILENLD